MRQVVSLTSTYSSDEFGICSALFELGGMIVMHDASGCNSTYTTHDEPRWYDQDSMVFISAISEMEAIMGDDQKLIDDLIETGRKLKPRFIAIIGAPIPYMTGCDLAAIARIVEEELQIPCAGFAANGMNGYLTGMNMAFSWIVDRFCTEPVEKSGTPSLNILGATPLDFSVNGSVESIREWAKAQGFEVNTCFAMGESLESLKRAGRAQVNLVISYGGIKAARILKERYGIPYVAGVPVGKTFPLHLAKELYRSMETGEDIIAYKTLPSNTNPKRILIGESILSGSYAAEGREIVVCPLETEEAFLRECDIHAPEEDDVREKMREAELVIADPLYRPLLQGGQQFTALPHTAFSGRIFEKTAPNFIGKELPWVKEK